MVEQVYEQLLEKIEELKNKIEDRDVCPEIRRQWIPKAEVMRFLGFADTQLCAITKKYKLVTTQIGKRKFYLASSLLKALEQNKDR
jgi:hypothetical protein